MSTPILGVELPDCARLDELLYVPFLSAGRVAGEVHWLSTLDPRIRTGIWRTQACDLARPIEFTGPETFQVWEGSAEVVVDDVVAMAVGPTDVGRVAEHKVAQWWIAAPFIKFFVLGGGPGS